MTADLLFTGGRVFTADPLRPYAQAVAVKGGRIAAVGPEAEVRRLRGPRTEVVDLSGRMLVPGFVDAHVHPVIAGMERSRCDLAELPGADAYLAKVARYAREHPDRPWIEGGGWAFAGFATGMPHREPLDEVSPDRPVYLVGSDHHSAWVNSRALELAGIDAATPDPADGHIERSAADGAPTGVLHEGAMELVARLLPKAERREYDAALLDAQRHLFSLGVTGWQDAIVGAYAGYDDQLDVYLNAAESGALKARVVGALWWDRAGGAEQVEELVARRARAAASGQDRFRATTVKVMQDGITENFTAGLLEPYLDDHGCPCRGRGLSYVDPALLPGHVAALDRHGFQVHFHAIGDRAVRECLDAVAGLPGPGGKRHHIAHLQIVHPDDIPRFAGLGVAANLQMLWAAHDRLMDQLTVPFLGAERASWQYPFGDLLRTGARLGAGSDWPVTSADPLQAVHVAVNRKLPEENAPAFLPHQRIGLADALHAYTAGSAWINDADEETGTIGPGRRADLAVLDRDPFALPPEEIWQTRVDMTLVDGEVVFERG